MHFFAPIIDHIEIIISQGGYWIIFVTSLLDGVPLLGSIIPGHTIIILAGFLAKIGTFKLSTIMFLAATGAILGDFVGFFLGKKYGYELLKKVSRHFWVRQEHIDKTKSIVNKHTGKAIIFGRFNPITRTLIPFVIGASGVHVKRFWLYDTIGGVIWSVLSILLGYLFGASYHVLADYMGKFVLLATIIVILIVWGYRFINQRWHIFVRYDIFTLVANIFSIYILFKTIQDTLVKHSFMSELDVSMNAFMSSHLSSMGISLMKFITFAGSPIPLSIIAVLISIFYISKNKLRKGILAVSSFAVIVFWTGFLKDIILRARPENALLTYADYSFPSLHAALAASMCVLVIYLWVSRVKKISTRELLITLSVFVSLLIAYSRIYLNVHWLSDVVAGYALGVFCTTFMILLLKYVSVLIVGRVTDIHEKP